MEVDLISKLLCNLRCVLFPRQDLGGLRLNEEKAENLQ